jgi:hypothetical protein
VKNDNIIRSSHYGHKPWWFRAVNNTWRTTYPMGTRPDLSKDSLIRAARKASGLQNFCRDFNEEPLDRLLLSINEETGLHPIGTFINRKR